MFDAWADPVEVRRVVCLVACVGVAVSSLEWLVPWCKLDANGLLQPSFPGPPRNFLAHVRRSLRATFVRAAVGLRLACALWFCVAVAAGRGDDAGIAVLLAGALSLPLRVRDPVGVLTGMDGPEHLLTATLLVLGPTFFVGSSLTLHAGLSFIAGLGLLEYAGAGWTKLRDARGWLSGRYLREVFASSTYGNATVAALLADRPAAGGALSLGVIGLELVVPLALVLPAPFAELLLGGVLTFHVVAAATMGLNTFVWAYAATYPAILHARDLIVGA